MHAAHPSSMTRSSNTWSASCFCDNEPFARHRFVSVSMPIRHLLPKGKLLALRHSVCADVSGTPLSSQGRTCEF
ncbi:hypothetical protein Hsero_2414 [Herbaspirillum seropedicae SmR1]|uniref:Uncharacterized protein n=1 Tax=Herbaspirillum seropedicae (strain SmR1) TaxID=757424 RepID=D8IVH4_HERSS|nr:hypothetical protein Hsero_2414 [Herbaspirillum seropedicae SmR1]